MATRKSSEKPVPQSVSKSAFVREQPIDVPAKDVVEAAKAVGIQLSAAFVYNIRSNAKKSTGAAPAKRGRGRTKVVSQSDEAAFRAMVVQLGTEKAKTLVAEVEAGLAAVIEGR